MSEARPERAGKVGSESAAEAVGPSPDPSPASPAEGRDWRRGFWSLFAVQFQGALSDNIFKFLVIFLIAQSVPEGTRDRYVSGILGLFALGFLMFSMAGGFAADRFRKKKVVVATKSMEVAVMSLGTLGFALQSLPLLLLVVFLMSVQSAFFGPSKYGLLPELLPHSRLSWGNGWIGLGTFLAVIGGGVLAGVLAEELRWVGAWKAGVGLVGLACAGLVAGQFIPAGRQADPGRRFRPNFLAEIRDNVRMIRLDRVLFLAVVANVFFWFLAALFGEPLVLIYGQDLLGLDPVDLSILKACMGVGIAAGCGVAGVVSGRKIEFGLVPLGAFGMACGALLLGIPGLGFWVVAALLAGIGFAGGFYTIPLVSAIQHRPDPKQKGTVVATHNWLTWIGILGASAAFFLFRSVLHLQPNTVFVLGGLLTMVAAVAAVKIAPEALVRLVLWLLTHTLYRVKVTGREHFPEKGGALVVSNHVSMADALLLIAATDRPIRFVLREDVVSRGVPGWIGRALRVVVVPSTVRPKAMAAALHEARQSVASGHVVGVIGSVPGASGGDVSGVPGKGIARIADGQSAPLVPVAISNRSGGPFVLAGGRLKWRFPRPLPGRASVTFGEPLPSGTPPEAVWGEIDRLSAGAAEPAGAEHGPAREP